MSTLPSLAEFILKLFSELNQTHSDKKQILKEFARELAKLGGAHGALNGRQDNAVIKLVPLADQVVELASKIKDKVSYDGDNPAVTMLKIFKKMVMDLVGAVKLKFKQKELINKIVDSLGKLDERTLMQKISKGVQVYGVGNFIAFQAEQLGEKIKGAFKKRGNPQERFLDKVRKKVATQPAK